MALETAVDESLSQQEVMKAINEDPTFIKITRILSILNGVKTAVVSLYRLIKTAKLVAEMNPYVTMSLTLYGAYRILRHLIFQPLSILGSFLLLRSRPLSKLKINYDTESAVHIYTDIESLGKFDSPQANYEQ